MGCVYTARVLFIWSDILKVLFVSLGCDKNLTNSEEMIGLLVKEGFVLTDDETEADVIVINTCAFIGDAKEESINTIIEYGELKQTGNLKALIVAGCLAQRYCDEICKELPEVDAVIGTTAYDKIVYAIKEALNGNKTKNLTDINKLVVTNFPRVLTNAGYYANLKIAEGCGKRCTYCIIPYLRGDYRSVPMEDLIKEAKRLADLGVKELTLIAQETTLYGTDLYGKKSLHILLEKLCEIDEIRMIRIMYMYPEEIYEELVETIAANDKICNYFDMPIQHCSDTVLKYMARKTTKEELIKNISYIRNKIPDAVLRTSLIAGFPGETKKDHKEMLDFIKEIKFDRLGCFTYSQEEGTVASTFENQIGEETKEKWKDEIMRTQQKIVFKKNKSLKGKVFKCIVDGKIPDSNIYVGRTYMDAPEIDGSVFFECDETLLSGDFANVLITGFEEYDLMGKFLAKN